MLLVTALYDIDGGSYSFGEYAEWLAPLFAVGVPLWVYCDPEHRDCIQARVPAQADVVVMGIPPSDFRMYSMIMSAGPKLPAERSAEKDTLEYLALINTKPEFVFRAAAMRPEESGFAFVDAGVAHVIGDLERAKRRLQALRQLVPHRALFPGIERRRRLTLGAASRAVCWRFCGGFFVSPREVLHDLCSACEEVIEDLLSRQMITWEVNVWALAELRGAPVEWYPGGHDDRLLDWPGAPG